MKDDSSWTTACDHLPVYIAIVMDARTQQRRQSNQSIRTETRIRIATIGTDSGEGKRRKTLRGGTKKTSRPKMEPKFSRGICGLLQNGCDCALKMLLAARRAVYGYNAGNV